MPGSLQWSAASMVGRAVRQTRLDPICQKTASRKSLWCCCRDWTKAKVRFWLVIIIVIVWESVSQSYCHFCCFHLIGLFLELPNLDRLLWRQLWTHTYQFDSHFPREPGFAGYPVMFFIRLFQTWGLSWHTAELSISLLTLSLGVPSVWILLLRVSLKQQDLDSWETVHNENRLDALSPSQQCWSTDDNHENHMVYLVFSWSANWWLRGLYIGFHQNAVTWGSDHFSTKTLTNNQLVSRYLPVAYLKNLDMSHPQSPPSLK